MNLNIDISKYTLPALGACCAIGFVVVLSAMRVPVNADLAEDLDVAGARVPENLELSAYIPSMEEVVAKHLFVPERVATGENAFPDLLVKGVYVGESHRTAVFSLKSKPEANLRVWLGDEEAALAQVDDPRDPRKPIVDFLSEWQIRDIGFAGVTVEHLITGEVETYNVDYAPQKHVKDSAGSGYGQGMVVEASPGQKAPAAKAPAQATAGQPRPAAFQPQAVAGRLGAYMQRLSPQQRQQFMQQLQKQNAAAGKKGAANQQKKSNGSSVNKKGNPKKRR
jgi:hypothetical protein